MVPICVSCGCGLLHDDHHDPRNITIEDLQAAADAANETLQCAAHNIESVVMHQYPVAKSDVQVGCEVFKATDELRYTLGVAYPANKPDVGRALDGYRDFAGPEALRDAAWSYMRKGARVGLDHRKGTDGAGTVVESYIWPGDDWEAPNGYTVRKGDWLLGVVWDESPWTDIKAGRRTGLSPQGAAKRRQPSPESLAQLRS